MAEITVVPSREAWLDRPILPTWQRVAALSLNWELIAYGFLVAVGLLLRLWDVDGRAVHHDESLHAYYSWQLFAGRGYQYDPLMHGPLQFEVVPLFYLLFGVSDGSARLLAVLLGTVLIALPYALRRYLTGPGALLASLMLTISPAFVYFSRFIRDDIYLAAFSLMMFIGIVRYLDEHKSRYLYLTSAAAALAAASMEAAYITFFMFGTFLIFEGVREFLTDRDGPVLTAWRATSLDIWLTVLSIFIAITVVLYSTFFTNPYGIWDTQHPGICTNCFSSHITWNSERKDILGGLTYWLSQQNVRRGDQPWFYYLLLLPLYEQLALLFGAIGLIYAFVRRSLATTFLAWWAVMAFAMYTWAGEKMPWLVIHIALPLILLGGLFLGNLIRLGNWKALLTAGLTFAALLAVEVHSTYALNFQDGANPTEMLIYVQTSNDVKHVVNEINALAPRAGGKTMPIGLDDTDVGGWPFIWYLRDYTAVTETASFNGPVCAGQYCPVLIMLEPEFDKYQSQLMQHYVVQKYRWNWWFPEDYKTWFPEHWGAALSGQGPFLPNILGTQQDWSHILNWFMYRTPFGDRGARWLYFLVRRDLVPGSHYYATSAPGVPPAAALHVPTLRTTLLQAFNRAGNTPLAGPRGIALAKDGSLYVADTLNHRIVRYVLGSDKRYHFSNTWGTAGTADGEFNSNSSPMGVAVGPDGLVYVADTWNERIQVFTPSGSFVRAWGGGPIGSGPGQFYGPRSVAVNASGRVYVADTGNRRIQIFSSTGHLVGVFGTSGTGPGQFQEPSAVAVGPDGTVYVADYWNQRIQAFTPSGSYLRSWTIPDWQAGSYDEPYLTVSAAGHVFASDPARQQVLEFTAQGKGVGSFGQFTLPIAVSALGQDVAVTDATGNQVLLYSVPGQNGKKQ